MGVVRRAPNIGGRLREHRLRHRAHEHTAFQGIHVHDNHSALPNCRIVSHMIWCSPPVFRMSMSKAFPIRHLDAAVIMCFRDTWDKRGAAHATLSDTPNHRTESSQCWLAIKIDAEWEDVARR